jgi:hypothetical protein
MKRPLWPATIVLVTLLASCATPAAAEMRVKPTKTPTPSPTASPTPSPTPTPTATSPTDPQPAGSAGGWTLVLRDEFDGTALNRNLWTPRWFGTEGKPSHPVNSSESACYDPNNVTVRDGYVRFYAEQRTCVADDGKVFNYASGAMFSNGLWQQFRPGMWVEARMYLPPNQDPTVSGVGSCGLNWPAFWTNGTSWPADGELDVMECLGHGDWTPPSDNVEAHTHYIGGDPGLRPAAWTNKMPATADGWHTFGAHRRTDGQVDFYYDGVKIGTLPLPPTSPHYLGTGLGISGTRTVVPWEIRVDHVRVWKPAG